jgi:2-polyprenyl-6-methoxyphenol hydroxylase-like FAD-dependent oxidoreductase
VTQSVKTGVCVAGGGPAGMMTGFILARAGVEVVVLEKHADFLRDFRGDTVHPSTMEAMYELGLLDRVALLRRLPAWVVGMGFRMEHVRAPNAHAG